MKFSFRLSPIRSACLPMAFLALVPLRAEAGIVLTTEAPGVQATTVSGAVTETFNSFPTGTTLAPLVTAVGTFSPGLAIVKANQYGGAGGTGGYAAIGAESGTTSTTLTLNGPQSFFGFYWSAADAGNSVQFYNGATLVGSFNPTSALGGLSSSYLGNPAAGYTGQDSGEKFAYLDFFGTNGTTITSIVFGNNGTGSGFEMDNFSVEAASVSPIAQVIAGGVLSTVPEPSSMILTGSALSFGAASLVRSRRRARSAA